ncbi:MAG: cation transporter [Gammaproteobacteria bacterium]|nr:cation transporter [Gammaproteobacteria bacterium]
MGLHDHSHHHSPRFGTAVMLNVGFVLVEAGAGFAAGSVALLADAGHNLSDVIALVLAWGASWMAARRPAGRHTYGLRKITVLAALASAMLLFVAVGAMVWESVQRLHTPVAVAALPMIVVAGAGVVVNGATALLFARGRHTDLNIRAAFVHMATDTAVSVAVALGGVAVIVTGWYGWDAVLALLVAVAILGATWQLFRDALLLLVDAVPQHVDLDAVADWLHALPGVTDLHDLHVWAMSTTECALTVHLVRPDPNPADLFLRQVADELRDRFGIGHSTIQIEHGVATAPCERALPDSV